MSLVFRFRVTFEDVDDVLRVIDVAATNTFKEFHNFIQETIGFDNLKPGSFYMANDTWRKEGSEFSTEAKQAAKSAGASELGRFIDDPHQKMLYVYDEEEGDWHLRVELVKLFRAETAISYPHLFKSDGTAPKQFISPSAIIDDPSAKLFKEADNLIEGLTDDDDLDEDEEEVEDEKDEFNLFGDEVDESEIDQSQINDGTPTE
jgi:hypothetical protein